MTLRRLFSVVSLRARWSLVLASAAGWLLASPALGAPATQEITYQGRVTESGQPMAGLADFEFRLFDDPLAGTQVGAALAASGYDVQGGLLSVTLDFRDSATPQPFDGSGRWLEIRVSRPVGSGAFVTLSPRQSLSPAPYALYALNGVPGPAGATGPTGAPGAAGAAGATGPTGSLISTWRNAYTPTLTYVVGDTVIYNGSIYIATANTGPGAFNPLAWNVIAQHGEDGAPGATGPTGPAGVDGVAGATGPTGSLISTWRSEHNPTLTYSTGDTVIYNGSIYLATANTGPGPFNPLAWNVIAQRGSDGAPGATGSPGAVGPTGPAGSGSAATIANRTRRVWLASGLFNGSGTGTGTPNFSAATFRYRAACITLPNDAVNVATASFVVPSDYAAGQPIPKLTIHWATDEGGAARQVDCDVAFTHLSNLTGPTAAIPFRYNFRASSGAAVNAMDAINPAQSAVVAQTLPEGTETYDNTPTAWTPGDVIILSIGRNGPSANDPSSGNMYLFGVSFDYDADM